MQVVSLDGGATEASEGKPGGMHESTPLSAGGPGSPTKDADAQSVSTAGADVRNFQYATKVGGRVGLGGGGMVQRSAL